MNLLNAVDALINVYNLDHIIHFVFDRSINLACKDLFTCKSKLYAMYVYLSVYFTTAAAFMCESVRDV